MTTANIRSSNHSLERTQTSRSDRDELREPMAASPGPLRLGVRHGEIGQKKALARGWLPISWRIGCVMEPLHPSTQELARDFYAPGSDRYQQRSGYGDGQLSGFECRAQGG